MKKKIQLMNDITQVLTVESEGAKAIITIGISSMEVDKADMKEIVRELMRISEELGWHE
jgi:SepF-like predicted cell division protein (DUF552 family)